MTSQRELESLLGSFFVDGPDQVADRVIEAALGQIEHTTQRRSLRLTWRFPQVNTLSRLVAAAVIGVLVVGGAFYFSRLAPPQVSASPSPSVSPSPSDPALVVPSPTAIQPTRVIRAGSLIAFIRTTDKPKATPDNPNLAQCPFTEGAMCAVPRLWIVGVDGTNAHELFPDGMTGQDLLGWTPDGSALLYTDNGAWYLTDLSGGEPQPVDTGCMEPCRGDYSPAFSSDGAHLLFIRGSADADGYDGPSDIATLDLASGRINELSSTANAGASLPGWSPDGTKIVFSTYGDKDLGIISPIPPKIAGVFVVDVDGQNLRRISPPDLNSDSAVWSPDGSRIVFIATGGDKRDIYTIRPDGTDVRQLTTDGISVSATWTPDGQILFVRGPGFWMMDADGTNAAELVPGSVVGAGPTDFQYSRPMWQPTGGPAIPPPPWHASPGTLIGPPPPTPVATPMPALASGFSWTGSTQPTVGGASAETATLLTDGRVLVTFACEPVAQLYDPTTGTFSPTGSMTVGRTWETATRLFDGRVLFSGGASCGNPDNPGVWASAELYNPATGTFSPTGSMDAPRFDHTATLLLDGRVLITGGQTGTPPLAGAFEVVFASYQSGGASDIHLAASSASVLATAELYDPATGAFSPTGSMIDFRDSHSATLLRDGQVLVLGGGGEGYPARTAAELYDPTDGTFSQTGSMQHARWLFSATLLNDGRVLIAGGRSPQNTTYASVEIYDPASGKFTSTGSMDASRQRHTATLLQDGRVLIAGGYRQDANSWDVLSTTELYDPASSTFTTIGSMGNALEGHTATLMNDGRVLIVGGQGIGSDGIVPSTSGVLYQP